MYKTLSDAIKEACWYLTVFPHMHAIVVKEQDDVVFRNTDLYTPVYGLKEPAIKPKSELVAVFATIR